ncbi:MAG TPA: ABC transporter ATP-binding protein [Acidobacteriota bacterium]|nr:ABC transporter ATP-binding protein [Acidobacteriota bacterium]
MTGPGRCVLQARNLSFSYRRPVVRGVTLNLTSKTVTGIIGPNGSGKTTVLRLLDGILRPASGEILLEEMPLTKLARRDIARRIAMVPQNGGAYYHQSVLQFALLGRSPHLSLLGFESAEDEEIALEALSMTRLLDYQASRVSELSGGEKQRLLLARALAQQARVLLLDEFTANLDINYQVELMRLVRRITLERGLATLVVSHEINLLAAFCDRILLMSEGEVRREGPVDEVITRENLHQLFGLDFTVRHLSGGIPEVQPILNEGSGP